VKVGVLALQGASRLHLAALTALGCAGVGVKRPEHLADVDGLIIPGGESTTISKLLDLSGLRDPVAERIAGGLPVLGTCAGMILLATDVADGRPDQRSFAAIDIDVRRNGYGRQVESFEADLHITVLAGGPFHAVFIRAPRVERCGPGVEVLATYDGDVMACRQQNVVATTFHPELTDDLRFHRWWIEEASTS
jgi:pyridoxal 5'-phosphate synthase pdxT subunit